MKNFTIKAFKPSFAADLINIIKTTPLPHTIKQYTSRQVIASPIDKCETMGIVLSGRVTIEHNTNDGRRSIIRTLEAQEIFGEILLFLETATYPYSIIACEETSILFIKRAPLLNLLQQSPDLLEQFLSHIANSYMILNKFIKMRSQKRIVNKIAYYLIYYGNIKSSGEKMRIKSKTEIAEFLGIERQSLIRELNLLKSANIIDYNLDYIYVKNYEALEKMIN